MALDTLIFSQPWLETISNRFAATTLSVKARETSWTNQLPCKPAEGFLNEGSSFGLKTRNRVWNGFVCQSCRIPVRNLFKTCSKPGIRWETGLPAPTLAKAAGYLFKTSSAVGGVGLAGNGNYNPFDVFVCVCGVIIHTTLPPSLPDWRAVKGPISLTERLLGSR